jgi:hypothetical protein
MNCILGISEATSQEELLLQPLLDISSVRIYYIKLEVQAL